MDRSKLTRVDAHQRWPGGCCADRDITAADKRGFTLIKTRIRRFVIRVHPRASAASLDLHNEPMIFRYSSSLNAGSVSVRTFPAAPSDKIALAAVSASGASMVHTRSYGPMGR